MQSLEPIKKLIAQKPARDKESPYLIRVSSNDAARDVGTVVDQKLDEKGRVIIQFIGAPAAWITVLAVAEVTKARAQSGRPCTVNVHRLEVLGKPRKVKDLPLPAATRAVGGALIAGTITAYDEDTGKVSFVAEDGDVSMIPMSETYIRLIAARIIIDSDPSDDKDVAK